MRTSLSRTLGVTAVAAAALLAAAGTASTAYAAGKSPTTLTATDSKATITLGQSDLITGTLKSGSTPVTGRAVLLERFVNGKLVPTQNHVTGGAGHVFYTVKPSTTTSYELKFLGTGTFSASHSNVITIVVVKPPKAPTTLTATDSKATITLGQSDLITGTLKTGSTPVPGQRVYLERFVNGKLVPTQNDVTGGAGHVFYTVRPSMTTSYELKFLGTGKFSASHSNVITIAVVKPPKAPTTLTATQSKTTINPGQSDLITGTLKSGTAPVTGQAVILERFVNGKLVPTQNHVTGGAGHVFYTVKPSKTTSYELKFLGTGKFDASHSNVITIVVVKAATTLTATESKTTINPGQSDLITGTLLSGTTPVPGQAVILERFVNGKLVPTQNHVTGGAGHVFYTVKPSKTTSYELVFLGTGAFDASHSNVVTVAVS